MTARNYDYIVSVGNATGFVSGNTVFGVSSGAQGLIANVNTVDNTLKIKLSNTFQEFIVGESLRSNSILSAADTTTNSAVYYNNANFTNVTVLSNSSSKSIKIDGKTNVFLFSSNVNSSDIYVYRDGTLVSPQEYIFPAANSGYISNARVNAASYGYQALQFKPSLQIRKGAVWTYVLGFISEVLNFFDDGSVNSFDGTRYVFEPSISTSNLTLLRSQYSLESRVYTAPAFISEVTTANTSVISVTPSTFIREKNAFEQNPIVRLYTIYYPGEWYPPNAAGNPTNGGEQYAWPSGFPFRFAEIRGDTISDILYRVSLGGEEYIPYPINSTGVQLDSTGKINEVTVVISNFDNLITNLVENSYLVGNNSANAVSATVNGEVVQNIDPRTVPGHALYDESIADSLGTNVAFDYLTTQEVNGTWVPLKQDTRDLLGAVVEIKTTFANFLDVWPEYSKVISKTSNVLEVYSTLPYRIGDNIKSSGSNVEATILDIKSPFLVINNDVPDITPGVNLYIVNPDASPDEYVLDTFKIDNLEGLDEKAAKFSLTSWLQYFKLRLPKRKYYKNTCPWVYHGEECQYTATGSDPYAPIPGTRLNSNGFFDINNIPTNNESEDSCAHNLVACELRNNSIHFGGFPGTGRTIPK